MLDSQFAVSLFVCFCFDLEHIHMDFTFQTTMEALQGYQGTTEHGHQRFGNMGIKGKYNWEHGNKGIF